MISLPVSIWVICSEERNGPCLWDSEWGKKGLNKVKRRIEPLEKNWPPSI